MRRLPEREESPDQLWRVKNDSEGQKAEKLKQCSATDYDASKKGRFYLGNSDALRLPVVSLSAEFLTIGHLMRRNVLAYKAPPNNEGYDLICIHPEPREVSDQVRLQVKSRYQTDCDRAFPLKAKTFDAFDFVVIVFLNIGYFYRKRPTIEGRGDPEFYTLPKDFVMSHHRRVESGFEKVLTKGLDMEAYRNEAGFELIAQALKIPYPARQAIAPNLADRAGAQGRRPSA